MMLSMSHGTDASVNGIVSQKSHIVPHFECLDLMNAVVPCVMLLALCYAIHLGK